MTVESPTPRDGFAALRRMLLLGISGIWLVVGVLFITGRAPLANDIPLPESVLVAICVVDLLVVWFWAKPKIPRRSPMLSAEDYWKDTQVISAAQVTLFLFEGAAILGLVFTLLSGSPYTALASALGVLGMVLVGPERIERLHQ